MTSVDANLLLYACNEDSPRHKSALTFLTGLRVRDDVAISELILAEFYTLLRNPTVVIRPLTPGEAVQVVQRYRRHPKWALLGFGPDSAELHRELWALAKRADFARRRIYDARTALSLRYQGVVEFATANVQDFEGFGFKRVWNPLEE
jgi:toxin-antitoxin system PIN domain toxin